MSVRPVLPWPHPLLLHKSGVVVNFDAHLREICDDLVDTANLAEAPCMAAVQIGAPARVIYISAALAGQALILVNPIVEMKSPITQHMKEACASLPGVVLDMQRAASIDVAAKNMRGDPFAFRCDGIFAQALQHELQHLDGITMIEGAKRAKRWFYRELLKKYGGADGGLLDYRTMRLGA